MIAVQKLRHGIVDLYFEMKGTHAASRGERLCFGNEPRADTFATDFGHNVQLVQKGVAATT